jgi:D-alanyl-lipoteichoic acid acyltransferase DltB (MBOAT superfamily)
MVFNSIGFLLFLPITFLIYWFVVNRNLKAQNIFLVCASYLFYGWWDYRFLALIAISTIVDYWVGLALQRAEIPKTRKLLVGLSLFANLGMLGFFKYYNFFVDSWISAWAGLGVEMHVSTLQIILPVGISFYTFQTLSYTFDVYRKKIPATSSFINFAAFVSFFPQLVAGPIERASQLLTQVAQKRCFNSERAISGINLILWGLFKKIVIADSCATYVDAIFNNYQDMNSMSLALGIVYFNFQVYCDFSGYSDIAIGTARLFGFELTRNFNLPYFSRSIAEFWRRWHITLFSWFKDYVYIPLGGSHKGKAIQIRNVFVVFFVIGLWHGAKWTVILFSLSHAVFLLPGILSKQTTKYQDQVAQNKAFPSIKELLQMLLTFSLVALSCVFFRSDTVEMALNYFKGLFFKFTFGIQHLLIDRYSVEILVMLGLFVWIEWAHRKYEHPFIGKFKWVKIVGIMALLLTLGVYSDYKQFIYFQF